MVREGAVAGRYRMKNEGQPSGRGLQGMYVLNEGAGCQVYRPTWQGTRTVFRPFPARDPENASAWDPFRLSDEDRDFGDWIRRYDVAFSFGNPGITFIIKDPRDRTSDDQQNPVWMLYRSIQQAVKSGQGLPAWNPLIFGATGRAAPINAPKDGYVMQGILMEHKSNPQTPPRGCKLEDQPVIMLMSQSAGGALLDTLSERKEDGTWKHGDVIDLDAGGFIQFHQIGSQRPADATGQPAGGTNMTLGGGAGGVADNNRYEAWILDQCNGIAPSFPGIHALAEAHVKSWDEIIRMPSTEEQVRMLCSAGIPASAIVYALGDAYSEFIPQHVFDQARGQQQSTTVPFAGADPDNPMGAPAGDANPMAAGNPPAAPAGPTGSTPDPSMPPVQSAPPASSPPPASAAPPGESPMTAAPAQSPPTAGTPAGAVAEAAGYDSQPTHADSGRSRGTMEALQNARRRSGAPAG